VRREARGEGREAAIGTAAARNVPAAALAALLIAAAPAVHGALFDDTEARRQIAVEKRRVDELNAQLSAQQQAVDARLGKIEDALKNQPLLDLFTQLEALKLELNKLRGQIEVLNNNVENNGKRQRDMYVDLDSRLRRLEQQAPASTAPPPAAGAPPVAGPGSPPAVAAPSVATAPPAGSAASGAPPDSAAETRAYEAAQGQRKIGNYQGAIVAFQNFIRQYPKSTLAPRAQYWIGDSYYNLRDFKLAIAGQQVLIRTYPDSSSVPDALLNIASSQIEMGETIAGRRTLEEVVARYPLSEAAEKAKRRLAGMGAPAGGPAATR